MFCLIIKSSHRYTKSLNNFTTLLNYFITSFFKPTFFLFLISLYFCFLQLITWFKRVWIFLLLLNFPIFQLCLGSIFFGMNAKIQELIDLNSNLIIKIKIKIYLVYMIAMSKTNKPHFQKSRTH